jgi:hypothetical protein
MFGQSTYPAPAFPAFKRDYDELDLESSSDEEHHRAPHRFLAPSPTPCLIGQKAKRPKASDSEESGSTEDDEGELKVTPNKMPRITKEERDVVCIWIQKERPDGKMCNGRWIRNGGAKGATMTATSGEVKTSGAQDALAA